MPGCLLQKQSYYFLRSVYILTLATSIAEQHVRAKLQLKIDYDSSKYNSR